MYTKEKVDELGHRWNVLDPDGDIIAPLVSEETADALLSHLNR